MIVQQYFNNAEIQKRVAKLDALKKLCPVLGKLSFYEIPIGKINNKSIWKRNKKNAKEIIK
jgi:hypothetical protein